MERHSRSYLQLIKPGITLSNTLSAVAGFFLAASLAPFSIWAFIGGIFGTALIIASACVVNNVLDRDIDQRMKRTVKREVAKGSISVPKALAYATVLGVAGFALLLAWTNMLTFSLGLLAYVWYVLIYAVAKRTTPLSTLVGGVPGALPPVAGYTALSGVIDGGALALFLILFFWQLPHFYAIGIFRREDYEKAGLPIWSVKYGLESTRRQIFMYIVLFAIATVLLTVWGYTGIIYLILSLGLSGYWVYKAIVLYKKIDPIKWSKAMFGISLLVLLLILFFIAIGGFLP